MKKTPASTLARTSYEIKELNSTTWPDFEKFFAKHNGVQGGCWCTFYHHPEGRLLKEGLEGKDAIALNRKEKKTLVTKGRFHGILVYSGGQAGGWCQYGPKDELPRIDLGRNYSRLDLSSDRNRKLWRLTCFFVDRDFRKKGVGRCRVEGSARFDTSAGRRNSRSLPVHFQGRWNMVSLVRNSSHVRERRLQSTSKA